MRDRAPVLQHPRSVPAGPWLLLGLQSPHAAVLAPPARGGVRACMGGWCLQRFVYKSGRACMHGWVVIAALCLQEWVCMHAHVGVGGICSALFTRVGVHACACGCGWYLQRFVYKNGRACMRMWVGAAVCLQNWGRVRAWVHSEGDISACVCVCVLQSACGSGGACMRGFTEQVTSAMYSLFLLLAVHHCKLVSRMLRLAISQSPDAHEQSKGAS